MKWFNKVLRHYADFSGRARRKEYWMFVLFNAIFSIAWSIVVFLFAVLIDRNNRFDEGILPMVISITWLSMIILPGMAVTVRRLHDTGKSGWMLLVGLIPLVGSVWLFILMVMDGQQGENKYGPDPKTTPETFSDKAKLTSAGVALIVASSVFLLFDLLLLIDSFFMEAGKQMGHIINSIPILILLAGGILLISKREREQTKPALFVLMGYFSIVCLQNLSSYLHFPSYTTWVEKMALPFIDFIFQSASFLISIALYLVLALMIVSILFMSQNRKLIRGAALAAIIAAGLYIFWEVCSITQIDGSFIRRAPLMAIKNLFIPFLPATFLIFAWTFFSKKE